jgi:hypothetical protein
MNIKRMILISSFLPVLLLLCIGIINIFIYFNTSRFIAVPVGMFIVVFSLLLVMNVYEKLWNVFYE